MVNAIVAMNVAPTPPSKGTCSHTPPENPTTQALARPVTLQDIKELILMVIEAKSLVPAKLPECPKSDAIKETKEVAGQALKPKYKKLEKMYVSD